LIGWLANDVDTWRNMSSLTFLGRHYKI